MNEEKNGNGSGVNKEGVLDVNKIKTGIALHGWLKDVPKSHERSFEGPGVFVGEVCIGPVPKDILTASESGTFDQAMVDDMNERLSLGSALWYEFADIEESLTKTWRDRKVLDAGYLFAGLALVNKDAAHQALENSNKVRELVFLQTGVRPWPKSESWSEMAKGRTSRAENHYRGYSYPASKNDGRRFVKDGKNMDTDGFGLKYRHWPRVARIQDAQRESFLC
jgi:hypothetical protein